MSSEPKHISVCICTYKRPLLLKRLLILMETQETDGLFTFSVVVADNDREQSAKAVVEEIASRSPMQVFYCVEPRQNIALARNLAIENASGNFIAFIDDDEFPIPRWLVKLYTACEDYGVDGVLGPVVPHFEAGTPPWVRRGGFYNRPIYPTGLRLDWRKGRTGNVLLKRDIIPAGRPAFREEFRAGEDQDFFRRMVGSGISLHLVGGCHRLRIRSSVSLPAVSHAAAGIVAWRQRCLAADRGGCEHREICARNRDLCICIAGSAAAGTTPVHDATCETL